MKAIDSKILVKEEKQQDLALTERLGGFQIPVGAGEFGVYKVLSVGEKVTSLKEGDVVYTYQNPGKEFKHEGKTYRVISIPDIIVVL